MDDYRLYSVKEVCERLHISRSTLYELRIRGELKHVRIGCRPKFAPEDLHAYIQTLRGKKEASADKSDAVK
ncbi:MAG: helix-turn-helix domain-containing protein [Pyrinomonadaceae bacterium]